MIRKIIKIDEEKCNGCGLCVNACHEGAIGMENGKAKLLRDDYCDGLGDCLPSCPTGAISFEHREALEYDEEAVLANMAAKGKTASCASMNAPTTFASPQEKKTLQFSFGGAASLAPKPPEVHIAPNGQQMKPILEMKRDADSSSKLYNWPIQIKLAPVNAPFFQGAKLLIAASCSAFSYGNFHEDFIKDHIVLIGCPKLDAVDYSDKLSEIIKHNDIKSVQCVRMEVPCCTGLETATKHALQKSGKMIPWGVSVLSRDGKIVEKL